MLNLSDRFWMLDEFDKVFGAGALCETILIGVIFTKFAQTVDVLCRLPCPGFDAESEPLFVSDFEK